MLTIHCWHNAFKSLRVQCLQIMAGTMLTNHCGCNAYKSLWVSIAGTIIINHNKKNLAETVLTANQFVLYNAYKTLRVQCLQIIVGQPCVYNAYKLLWVSLAVTLLTTDSC